MKIYNAHIGTCHDAETRTVMYAFTQEMYSQLYAQGKEIHLRDIPDPFEMNRGKWQFWEEIRDSWRKIGKKQERKT